MIRWALDLGTKTGWAVHTGVNLVSGVWDFSPKRGESYGTRFLRFEHKLRETLEYTGKPDLIVYEIVHAHKGTSAAHVYGGMQAILTKWCEANNIQYSTCSVQSVKKAATGKGNAPKKLVEAAARSNWPDQLIRDDNQADALWILHVSENEGI